MTEQWDRESVLGEVGRRLSVYLAATHVEVDYYRIGFRFAFELPVSERPRRFPSGVLGSDRAYPWLIWLGWQLEDRWRILAQAARFARGGQLGGGVQAEQKLAAELAALGKWESYDADYSGAGLVTASLAAVCADVLHNADSHDALVTSAAATTAGRILDESISGWYETTWRGVNPAELPHADMHNIRCVTLLRGAQIASLVRHQMAETLQNKSAELYAAWLTARTSSPPMTEGPAYDGLLLESMTEWLATRPDRDALQAAGRDVLAVVSADWARVSLPGRPDVLAPVGDVEPEMTQWAAAGVRLCRWYHAETGPASSWFRTFPLHRFPANALPDAYELPPDNEEFPATGAHLQPSTVTLRSGWKDADPVAVVGASRTSVGHLQNDGGQLVLGWHGRWWISDPGYQQYRLGDERDFTIGPLAHNPPVVGGIAQSVPTAVARLREEDALIAEIDVTRCYQGLPEGAAVHRDVRMRDESITVRDHVTGLAENTVIGTHWHVDGELAWSFIGDAVRLSDGERALWLATSGADGLERLEPSGLVRHPGTRGQLRFDHQWFVSGSPSVRWWFFVLDPAGGWQPPLARLEQVGAAIGS